MENILYLDDYINIYNKKKDLTLVYKPYKHTLKYGKIIDRNKFIKKYNKIMVENKLNQNFFTSNITVITNGFYTKEDKRIISDTLESLNYKKINFISELKYLKLNKKNILLNAGFLYIGIYYLNNLGNFEVIFLDNNKILNNMLIRILEIFKNKKIYVFGKNYENIVKMLDEYNLNYYFYEDGENLIIKKAKDGK